MSWRSAINRAALCVPLALAIVGSTPAVAEDACVSTPNCQEQVQAPIHYSAWDTKGWAYYCTGDHPFFWSSEWGLTGYSKNNNCFSIIEQANSGGSKFDGLITNWCLKSEDLVITLGCSNIPQNTSCTTESSAVSDPQCPIVGGVQNTCDNGGGPVPPVCVQTWEEVCSNQDRYSCVDDLDVSWCFRCSS